MHRNYLVFEKVAIIVWEVGAFNAIGKWEIIMTICSESQSGRHVVKYLDYGYGTHRTDCLTSRMLQEIKTSDCLSNS